MLALYLAIIDDELEKKRFEKIYNNYKNQMFYVANSILHNTYDAEDVVQEAFLSIAKNMKTIQKISNENDIRNYVLKSSKNRAINMIAKKSKRDQQVDIDSLYDLADNSFVDDICAKYTYDKVLSVLRNMDATYRDVLYYHFVMSFSAKETAVVMNKKLSTVKQQLVRGKKIFLELLSLEGIGEYIND